MLRMGYISWDDFYALAEELYAATGTINVAARFEYRGYPFGDWISRQRGIERRKGLKPIRKEKLEKLGIIWNGHEIKEDINHQKFLQMYKLLQEYKEQFGNTRVPRNYIVDGANLGSWVSELRESLRESGKKVLTDHQKALLDEINFETNWYQEGLASSWEKNFAIVAEYASRYGIDEIIQSTTYKHKNIGNWVHSQRIAYKEGKLLESRFKRLAELGLDFSPASGRWEKAFALAEIYFREFHNLDVPSDFIMSDFNLGRWISNQRQIYRSTRADMILTEEQIRRLESIGMVWKSAKASNTSFLEQAFFYYIQQLHPDTTTRDVSYGIELDVFIPSLKFALEYDGSYWHKGKISKDNKKDSVCRDKGIRLVRIRETPLTDTESAICYHTISKQTNPTLAILISQVIEEQLGQTIDVNNERDCFEIIKNYQHLSGRSWYEYYIEAECYFNVNNNLLVPVSYVSASGKKLGKWIQNQRSAFKGTSYSHLSAKEVQMLEAIGMVWDVRNDSWNRNYKVACDYYNEYGNLLVSRDSKYHGFNLGRWINDQRNAHNMVGRRKMSPERAKNLEEIGMVWNTRSKHD